MMTLIVLMLVTNVQTIRSGKHPNEISVEDVRDIVLSLKLVLGLQCVKIGMENSAKFSQASKFLMQGLIIAHD